MTTRVKIIIVVVALATSYAAGRWSAPEKVKIVTQTVEVEKKTNDKTVDKDQKVTVIVNTKPNGEKTETTITENKTKDDVKTTDTHTTTKSDDKEVTKSQSRLNLSVLGGVDARGPQVSPVFGGHVSKEVLGPVSVGLWGLSNGSAGVSLGLTF